MAKLFVFMGDPLQVLLNMKLDLLSFFYDFNMGVGCT